MKAKINGIYLRMQPKMRFVRVIDFVTMESGERGLVFVNREATDEQIQNHTIRFDTLPEQEFFKIYAPLLLSDGDEINVFKGSEHVGVFTVKETDDEMAFKCEELDGILFDARIAVGGGLTAIYTPASQQCRYFGIISSDATHREAAQIVNDLIADAKQYIECVKTYPVTAFIDMERLRALKKMQSEKLAEVATAMQGTIPVLAHC